MRAIFRSKINKKDYLRIQKVCNIIRKLEKIKMIVILYKEFHPFTILFISSAAL